MYGKCAATCVSTKMFLMLAKGEQPLKALEFFCKMYIDGFSPNQATFLSAITSCTRLRNLSYGEFIHGKIIKNRFENDVRVRSLLVSLYAKWDRVYCAHRCFNEILDKNLVSWNALLLGYSNRGCSCSASIVLLREMIQSRISPNEVSFCTVTKSLLPLELLHVHSLFVKMGYHLNGYVSSALMTSYAKHGMADDALSFYDYDKKPPSVVHSNIIAWMYNKSGQYHKTQELFCDVKDPDIVSWNILIAACSRNGDYKEAFELFHHMQMDRVTPDNYTYVSLLSICTKLCNLALGRSLHALMIKADFNRSDTMVHNVMIDMYAKCRGLGCTVKIFDEMRDKNVISWTTIVSALVLHGHGQEVVERFREMEMVGIEPDKVAFIDALSACRHVGLIKEGMELFEKMKAKYGIEPQMEEYLLVVDLMARYDQLKEAEKLISRMPFAPNACIWRSFLCISDSFFKGYML